MKISTGGFCLTLESFCALRHSCSKSQPSCGGRRPPRSWRWRSSRTLSAEERRSERAERSAIEPLRRPAVDPVVARASPVSPPEQRVRRHTRGDLAPRATPHPDGAPRELPPVVIGEAKASPTQLPSQEVVLFDQVRDRVPLRRSRQPVSTINNIWRAQRSITSGSLSRGQLFRVHKQGRPSFGTFRAPEVLEQLARNRLGRQAHALQYRCAQLRCLVVRADGAFVDRERPVEEGGLYKEVRLVRRFGNQ